MIAEYQFSAARSSLTEIVDNTWNRYLPAIIKRRNAEEILVMRQDMLKDILKSYPLRPKVFTEDDGSTTIALDELDIAVNGTAKDEAVNGLVNELKIYAEDYYSRIGLFINSTNRKQHLPYIFRIWLCKNDDEIKSLLEM
ncbi:MAG: exoribonuclease R [Peptococcaceae bacterium]|jgi:hypothetical protein|nr:exoribonuclease R [Peptococcaceae bacterium]